jgi:hypothetical protein
MSKVHIVRGKLEMNIRCRAIARYVCVVRVVARSGRWKRSILVRIAAGHIFFLRLPLGKLPWHLRRLQVATYLAVAHSDYRKLAQRTVAVR